MNFNPDNKNLRLVRTEDILSTQIRHYETEVDGTKIHWVKAGRGRPIIFLHTIFGSWDHFNELIPSFADEFSVIIPDLPGLGPHGREKELPYSHTLDGYSRFLDNFSQRLDLKKFHLVGSSLGSLIGLKYAVQNPWKLQSLTLQGIPTSFHPLVGKFSRLLLFPPNAKLFNILPFKIFYQIIKRDPNLIGTEDQKKTWAHRAKQSSFRAFAEVAHSILHTKIEEVARRLTTPTLVIDGDKAVWPKREDTQKFASIIPNICGPIFINGAGHNVPREKPGEFAKAIKKFIITVCPQVISN